MGERLIQALPRMKTKPAGSFREFNRYIKQCKSSWRRVKPSTRLTMISIELIISFMWEIKYGFTLARIG